MSRPASATHDSHPSHHSHFATRVGAAVPNHNSHSSHSSQPAAVRGSAGEHQGAAMEKGWQTKTLGEVCQFRGGGTPSKAVERYWRGDIPWVSPKDMKFNVVCDSIDHISQQAIESSATSLIPKNSVLMVVRSGILARTVPIAITGRDLTINQDLKALGPNGTVDARFLYHFLHSKMDVLLSMVGRGATIHRLMTEQIRSLDLVLPPLPEQQRIVGILDEAFTSWSIATANWPWSKPKQGMKN